MIQEITFSRAMLNHEIVGLGYAATAIISRVSSINPLAIIAQATAFLVVPIFTRIADSLIPSNERMKKSIHVLISFGMVGVAGQYMNVSWSENFATAACLIAAQWMISRIGNGQDEIPDNVQIKTEGEPKVKTTFAVNETVPSTPNVYHIVRGLRFDAIYWDDFLTKLRESTGINFVEANKDLGPDQRVIVVDYWGRPGGDLASNSNLFCNKAPVVYVIVEPIERESKEEFFGESQVIRLSYQPGSTLQKLSGTDTLKKVLLK